jgi:hypothetical protein
MPHVKTKFYFIKKVPKSKKFKKKTHKKILAKDGRATSPSLHREPAIAPPNDGVSHPLVKWWIPQPPPTDGTACLAAPSKRGGSHSQRRGCSHDQPLQRGWLMRLPPTKGWLMRPPHLFGVATRATPRLEVAT